MRVFVAGATGAIGRPLVARLLAAGHEVTGMTRSPERAEALRAAGADAAVADVFDRDALRAALAAARPEVVVDQLTDIPQDLDLRTYADQMAGLQRVRGQGCAILAEAAREVGARKLVAQSIAFVCTPGEGAASEDEAVWHDAPEPFATTLRATLAGERAILGSGLDGLVLRYGWFYGPGTRYAADGSTIEIASGATGVLNVVDDDPAPLAEWLPATAAAIGARKPLRVPAVLARIAAGPHAVAFSTEQRGVANGRAKEALGWPPARPTLRGALGT